MNAIAIPGTERMSDIAISIKNLSKVYKLYDKHIDRMKEALHPFHKKYHRPFYALKNIDLEIKKGEILGIVGRNGAGKSTLLKIISGVLTPTGGAVDIKGDVSALLELSTGFNPQLTGLENIYFNGTINGLSRKTIDDKIDDIIEFADIGEFINQPIKTYSSGMRSRLGFAVAIHMKPEILILDEVLSVGDELFRRKCYAKMEELFNSGCTVLFVSHSINSINEICTRAIMLDNGNILLEGPPKFVTMHYQKLLFVKPRDADNLRKEIVLLNKDEENKKKFASQELQEEADVKPVPTEKEKSANVLANGERVPLERLKPYFIPGFKSKSTVQTRNYDVDIYDIQIRTLSGQKVNVLSAGEEYIYSYKVKFGVTLENLNFGMGIRNEKGLPLTYMLYPSMDKYINREFPKGQNVLLDWHFACRLTRGNYYIDPSIGTLKNGERQIVNKIVDAMVFKVQAASERQIGGIFDSSQRCRLELFQ